MDANYLRGIREKRREIVYLNAYFIVIHLLEFGIESHTYHRDILYVFFFLIR